MKKLLALLLVLSLTATLLCSCKKEDAEKGGAEETSGPTQETTIDVTTLGNYYQDLTTPEVIEGNVTYQVYQAWWEDSELVVQMYIINGMTDPIYDLFIENYYAYNEDGLIGQIAIGPLDCEPIPAGEYSLETFYFGYGVDLPDADLSTLTVDCVIDFIY